MKGQGNGALRRHFDCIKEFEYTKGVTSIRNSTDREHNGEEKKD